MVKPFKKEHNGVTYNGVRDDEALVEGSITRGNKKWILRGHPKINRIDGSYKWGDQVQITIWNTAGSTTEQDRVGYATSWDTVEIFFPPELWKQLFDEYMKAQPGL